MNCDTIGLGLTQPVYEYFHADNGVFTGRSITAGYVYRGSIPDLYGKFVFGDFIAGKVWTYHVDGPDTVIDDHTIPLGIPQQPFIVSFGRDVQGELYFVDYVGGKLYKIVPWIPPTIDCNGNFSEDSIDISREFSSDSNGNGIPDECEPCCDVAGDANGDGRANIADVTFIISRIFTGGAPPACNDAADANGDNTINIADVTYLIARIFAGGPAPVCGTTGI
ncbi:MAG: dockerin type I repeat-containing protein [candidate division Zixibacteria bacterium]|nr:dockerin type I repeat-containing protein [candidate division Zixibacteria bacterium]